MGRSKKIKVPRRAERSDSDALDDVLLWIDDVQRVGRGVLKGENVSCSPEGAARLMAYHLERIFGLSVQVKVLRTERKR